MDIIRTACSLLSIIFSFLLAFPLSSYALPEEKPSVAITGLYSIPRSELLYLLDITAGKVPDPASLRWGIKRAFRKGIFDDIIVESSENDNVSLQITVIEKPVIDSVTVKDNDYFSARVIRKFIEIHEKERLNYLNINKSMTVVGTELRKRGFPNADAHYEILPKKDNHVDIVFYIAEGLPDIVKEINISGPRETVMRYLRLSPGEVMDGTELSGLQRKIMQYYMENGHVGVVFSYSFDNGTLNIKLNPGVKMHIVFTGNNAVSSANLMNEVKFFDLNEFNDELLEETTARIVSLYHKNGYPYVQVAPITNIGKDDISLNYFIFEGEKFIVDSVAFPGVSFSEVRLADMLVMGKGDNFNPDYLDSDAETIKELYHSLGYIYAETDNPEVTMSEGKVRIVYHIKEGARVTVAALSFRNMKNLSEKELLDGVQIKKGDPYNELDISDARRKIQENYSKRGYLDAVISSDISIEGTDAQIVFDISEGEITFFGKNIIAGNIATKTKVIERELYHLTGKPLDYSLILKEKQRLYKTGLFSDIDTELLERTGRMRDLKISMKEAEAGAVEFGLGYGEYEKQRGFFDLSYKNLLGLNKQGSFRTELSSLEQRFILSYQEPWFLENELLFKALVLHENRKEKSIDTKEILYRLKRDSASVGVEKKLGDAYKADITYEFSVVDTTDVKPDIVLSREDIGSLIISGIRPGIIYDTRDNPFDPKKGVLAGISFKIASAVLFSETDFFKMMIYANKYQSLSKRTVLAVSLRGGTAKGFGNTRELPIVERFFLGGRTSVRGYNQDSLGPKGQDGTPTGGNAFAEGNLEIRNAVTKNLGIVTFLDGGNVWRKTEEMDLQLKFSAGMGLRYSTPVGPLRIDYGYKLNREVGESKGEIHFSLGQAF